MNICKALLGAVLAAALPSGRLQASEHEAALSPSALNGNPSQYNRKTVTVRGCITLVAEGRNIYESQNIKAEFDRHVAAGGADNFKPREWDKYCLTIANPGPMDKHPSVFDKQTLTIKGKFVDDYLTPRTLDLGACPLPTAIFIDYTDLRKRYPALFHEDRRTRCSRSPWTQ
ncbi:hypothetical protein [Fulvimonas soli]|jgi:hypothetical protein|uniref:hypothetical protein n=1 Tax=Fulvimonas soli TaxID=155197 RepID=UPI001122A09D|nr:hypothetical protein [Fulvimonas soli]